MLNVDRAMEVMNQSKDEIRRNARAHELVSNSAIRRTKRGAKVFAATVEFLAGCATPSADACLLELELQNVRAADDRRKERERRKKQAKARK